MRALPTFLDRKTATLRLLKKASTALITQIRKNDYSDISMGFNL